MEDILYLRDARGELRAVQLSNALWEKTKTHILAVQDVPQPPQEYAEPLEAWEEFKAYWDFQYPFCADVSCAYCGAQSADWEHDPAHPFKLRNAHLGGLLVFHCTACGATVRKKHFKDHMVFEMTPPGEGCGRR